MSIKISVVVPTYKRPALLLRCIEALLTQQFDREACEIIVVSDGPDELTASELSRVITQSPDSVKYLVLPENKGPAAARNFGWLNAKGKLVAFTDDDCIPDKQWLQAFYDSYDGSENVALTGRTQVPVSKNPTDYEQNIANLQTADFITANCCITKMALTVTRGFDEEFTMAWREDSDLQFKLICADIPIQKVNEAVVTHPVRHAKWGISIHEQKKTIFNALLYKKHPKLYREKIQPVPPVNYYLILLAFIIMITGLLLKTLLLFQIGFSVWAILSLLFIYKRLRFTSLAPGHFLEMALTSLLIPFLSIYWQFYGAFKYRVLFL